MLNEDAVKACLLSRFPGAGKVDVRRLGSGVQGSGFFAAIEMPEGVREYVVKTLLPEGFGHDYPSDRAGVFLLDLDEYANLPRHVKGIDVLAEMKDGSVRSIGGGKEYYLLMEKAEGKDYFQDLFDLSRKDRLGGSDIGKIEGMASYLAEIHRVKKDSRALYRRKLRDTVGHGECLMGVLDMYPDGILSNEEMASIVKSSVEWVYRLRSRYERLSQIHGDFHPGNIWFRDDGDFILLDRSRGPWGEPADDVAALTINYIFFSVRYFGRMWGPYHDALRLFYAKYVEASGDRDIYEMVQPFYAFRGVVVANPVFYPELTEEQRRLMFAFVHNVLGLDLFEPERADEYLR